MNQIYNRIFQGTLPVESLRQDRHELSPSQRIHFVHNEKNWIDTLKTVVLFVGKMIVPFWGEYSFVKWSIQRLIMMAAYPAQSRLVQKYFLPDLGSDALGSLSVRIANNLSDRYIVRHVRFKEDGVVMSGFMVGKPDTIQNGKWVLQSTGNASPAEHNFDFALHYSRIGFNTLLMNPPGVGLSGGTFTPETAGSAQKTALLFLKKKCNANRIVMAGFSMGGAVVGRGIMKHDFADRDQVRYLVVRQVTFSKLSEIGAKFGQLLRIPIDFTKKLIHWAECELDNVESSRKLSDLQIPEVVIRASGDGIVTEDVSLMHALTEENLEDGKRFNIVLGSHNSTDVVLESTVQAIHTWDHQA